MKRAIFMVIAFIGITGCAVQEYACLERDEHGDCVEYVRMKANSLQYYYPVIYTNPYQPTHYYIEQNKPNFAESRQNVMKPSVDSAPVVKKLARHQQQHGVETQKGKPRAYNSVEFEEMVVSDKPLKLVKRRVNENKSGPANQFKDGIPAQVKTKRG